MCEVENSQGTLCNSALVVSPGRFSEIKSKLGKQNNKISHSIGWQLITKYIYNKKFPVSNSSKKTLTHTQNNFEITKNFVFCQITNLSYLEQGRLVNEMHANFKGFLEILTSLEKILLTSCQLQQGHRRNTWPSFHLKNKKNTIKSTD